jgi:hypothetical protein
MRATIHFCHGKETEAIVYSHFDGDSLDEDLKEFFADVEKQAPKDTRFDDPTYLAARFVVWKAANHVASSKKHGYGSGNLVDFTGIGIYMTDPSDLSCSWTVDCGGKGKRPTVKNRPLKS